MDQEGVWQLYSTIDNNNETVVEFESATSQFFGLIEDLNINEKLPVKIKHSVLLRLQQFLKAHKYSETTMKFTKPVKNEHVYDNIDPISYEQMKDLIDGSPEEIKDIYDACNYLEFKIMKNILSCLIACEYYVGQTEQDLENFKNQNNLHELQPEEEIAIINKYEPIFDDLKARFMMEMEEEQKKFQNNNPNQQENNN